MSVIWWHIRHAMNGSSLLTMIWYIPFPAAVTAAHIWLTLLTYLILFRDTARQEHGVSDLLSPILSIGI